MSLNRQAFLAAAKLNVKKVCVQPYGDLFIKEMTGSERDFFEASLMDASGKTQTKGMRARLVMLSVCDAEGNRIFADDDLDAINAAPARALGELADAIITLNGLKPDDVEGN